MRSAHRPPPSSRPGLTLIELLVVIGIIAGLAALVALIFPRLQDSQRTSKGADIVQGQLFIARQMALRDQLARGVRLVSTGASGPNVFDQVQLIEQPAPYTTGLVINPNAIPWPADPTNQGLFPVTFGPDSSGAVPDFSTGAVQAGDLLDLAAANDSYTVVAPPAAGALHLIMKVQAATATTPATVWVLTPPSIPNTAPPVLNYRIIRSPRPLTGQAPVNLPNGIVVDAPSPLGGSLIPQDTDSNFEVLFDPSGKVLRASGSQGKVVLWVKDVSNDQMTADQTLIAVYTRNGLITAQPVNSQGDPYAFVKDGATSGM